MPLRRFSTKNRNGRFVGFPAEVCVQSPHRRKGAAAFPGVLRSPNSQSDANQPTELSLLCLRNSLFLPVCAAGWMSGRKCPFFILFGVEDLPHCILALWSLQSCGDRLPELPLYSQSTRNPDETIHLLPPIESVSACLENGLLFLTFAR